MNENKTYQNISEGHIREITCIEVSPDNTVFATCSKDKSICIWNMQYLYLIYKLLGHENYIRCIVFS
jgi:WD40 repeat protein